MVFVFLDDFISPNSQQSDPHSYVCAARQLPNGPFAFAVCRTSLCWKLSPSVQMQYLLLFHSWTCVYMHMYGDLQLCVCRTSMGGEEDLEL